MLCIAMLLQKHHILHWVGQPSPFCVGEKSQDWIGLKWVEHSGTRGTDSAETYCAMIGWVWNHGILWLAEGLAATTNQLIVPWDFPTAAQQWWDNVAARYTCPGIFLACHAKVWSTVSSKTHLTLVRLVHVGSMFSLNPLLVGGLEHEFFDFPSSQLTFTPWFFRGVGQPPTRLNFMKSQWPFTTSPTVRRSMALSRALPLSLCHTSIWSLGTLEVHWRFSRLDMDAGVRPVHPGR